MKSCLGGTVSKTPHQRDTFTLGLYLQFGVDTLLVGDSLGAAAAQVLLHPCLAVTSDGDHIDRCEQCEIVHVYAVFCRISAFPGEAFRAPF